MGSRVNYVVVRDGKHTVYAQGGGAGYSIDYNFALGPDLVLRWLANAGNNVRDHWFDDVLCEGGVLIDVDRLVLLLFNTTSNDVAYRAAMLQAYATTWPRWEIRWAYDGVADLMTYIGLDPAAVRDDDRPEPTERNEFGPNDPVAAVVTIRDADGLVRIYGLNFERAWRRWRMGPDLVEWVTAGPELSENVADGMPTAGLHLDPATRRAALWTVEPLCGLRQRWAELWPGWTLEFWGDDLARQAVHNPDRLYGSITPGTIAECREVLAKRLQDNWPVRSTMLTDGVDVDMIYRFNIAGFRSQLDANVTAEEIQRIAALLCGPQTADRVTTKPVVQRPPYGTRVAAARNACRQGNSRC